MKASLLNKLDILQDRFEELTALLGDGEGRDMYVLVWQLFPKSEMYVNL